MENKEALNAMEVAELLNITKNTVYELVKRGEIPAYKVGKKLRIDKSDVKEYIDNQKHKKLVSKSKVKKINEAETDDTDDSIVLTGQDIILDILANLIQTEGYRVLRSNMGSYRGLHSLYMDEVTLCTSHMWDGDSDTYNEPYVKTIVPGTSCVIINLAYRIQGFYVKKGNPKKITKWEDIAKDGIRLINREKGAGTRVLLDEKIKKLGISVKMIAGYDNEETSHLSIASAVARGDADVGIGTEKVALQVGAVDFIPMQKERYDLVIKKEKLADEKYARILEIVKSSQFKKEIDGLGGYDTKDTGKIMAIT